MKMCICPHKKNNCGLFAFRTTPNRVSGVPFPRRTLHSLNIYRMRNAAHSDARITSNKLINFIFLDSTHIGSTQTGMMAAVSRWTVVFVQTTQQYRRHDSMAATHVAEIFHNWHSLTHACTQASFRTHTHTRVAKTPLCCSQSVLVVD